MPTAEVSRRHGISSTTFYKWMARYGGLEVSAAWRLRQLVHENARLKMLLADSMLDNAMLKEIGARTRYCPVPGGRRWLISSKFSR